MDRLVSFEHLCRQASEGRDFVIETRPGRSNLAVMAPHGGRIEPGTDVLADAIAGREHGYYAFKGLRILNNAGLHLASERFDEPRALHLAGKVRSVITVHGCRGPRPVVYAGGLATGLKLEVIKSLKAAGFEAGESPGPSLAGVRRSNLCNRGRSGKGLQLEVSQKLRLHLTGRYGYRPGTNHRFHVFVDAVRRVLDRFI